MFFLYLVRTWHQYILQDIYSRSYQIQRLHRYLHFYKVNWHMPSALECSLKKEIESELKSLLIPSFSRHMLSLFNVPNLYARIPFSDAAANIVSFFFSFLELLLCFYYYYYYYYYYSTYTLAPQQFFWNLFTKQLSLLSVYYYHFWVMQLQFSLANFLYSVSVIHFSTACLCDQFRFSSNPSMIG